MLLLCSGTGRDNAERGRARPQVAVTAANVVVGAESKLAKAVGGSLRPFKNSHAQRKVVLVERQKKVEPEVHTIENTNPSANYSKSENENVSESEISSTTTPVVSKQPQIMVSETDTEFIANLIAQELTLGMEHAHLSLNEIMDKYIDELNDISFPLPPLVQPSLSASASPSASPPPTPQHHHHLYSPRRLWHKLLSKLSRRSTFTSL